MHVLIVSIKVKEGEGERFRAAIEDDARYSVQDEPGCLRFEVLRDNADANRWWLLEVYQDEAAFQAHTQTPHFKRFFEAAGPIMDGEPSISFASSEFPPNASDWSAKA